jgi:hypothetical protein
MRIRGLAVAGMLVLTASVVGHPSSARAEYGATRSSAGHRQSVGWLWLGLAPGARSLQPVDRRMGPVPVVAGKTSTVSWGGRYGSYDDWGALVSRTEAGGPSRGWGNP